MSAKFSKFALRDDGPCEGAFSLPGGGTFDPNFGLDYIPGSPTPLKDIIPDVKRKVLDNLQKFGYERSLKKNRPSGGLRIIASEVGDDEAMVSNSPLLPACLLVCSEYLGMQTSWEDTAIHPRYGNFCEDLVVLPNSETQTHSYVRKNSRPQDMAFLDVVKLRLAIGVRPMRMDHSSTNDGKASMVGKRMSWISSKSPLKGRWEIFSLFQDLELNLIRDRKFAYLPEQLGGYGKPFPFDNVENFNKFNAGFKQGQWKELHQEIIRRFNAFYLEYTREGPAVPEDLLLSHIVRYESAWHDWVKGSTVYAPTCWIDAPEWIQDYVLAHPSQDRLTNDICSRLLASRHAVSETTIKVAIEHNELCEALTGATNMREFADLREAKVQEWKNSSIYSLREYGFLKPIMVGLTHTPLLAHELENFSMITSSQRFNLKGLLKHEPIYDRKVIDQIYQTGPMALNMELIPQNIMGVPTLAYNDRFHPRDIEEPLLVGIYDKLYEWLKNKEPIERIPQYAVQDDDVLLKQIQNFGPLDCVAIVTNDIRLCKTANFTTQKVVIRIPCEYYAMASPNGDADMILQKCRNFYPQGTWRLLVDTGSFEAVKLDMIDFDLFLKERLVGTYPLFDHHSVKRETSFIEVEYKELPGFPDRFLFDHRNITRKRRFAHLREPKLRRSDSKNWLRDREERSSPMSSVEDVRNG